MRNEASCRCRFTLELEVGADFADIISVKEHDFALGDPLHARPLPPPAAVRFDGDGQPARARGERARRRRRRSSSRSPARPTASASRFRLELGAARGAGTSAWTSSPRSPARRRTRTRSSDRFGEERRRARLARRLAPARAAAASTWDDDCSTRSRSRSPTSRRCACGRAARRRHAPCRRHAVVHDRVRPGHAHHLPADDGARAGARGRGARRARRAAGRPTTTRRSTPSRARSSTSCAAAGPPRRGSRAYYGTVGRDAALPRPALRGLALDGRRGLVQRLREPGARRRSSGSTSTATATATASSSTSGATPRGLENQSWKDSGDSQRFHDGTLARPPIAPVEVQGYVYDAKLRLAELAREVWHDEALAARLELEAAELRRASTRPSGSRTRRRLLRARARRRQAAASTRSARTSATCSGAGSSRPSGRSAVADRLTSATLWSGWGIRTMSTGDAGYNPLSYHNGTVWPHDTSLAAWGLARCGPAGGGAARSRARCSRRRATSTGRCPRSSPASRAARRRFRSPTRRRRGRRPGRPARPCCCCGLLLGLEADAGRATLRATRRPAPVGRRGSMLTASAPSGAPGTLSQMAAASTRGSRVR